jgi:hypothetical protein
MKEILNAILDPSGQTEGFAAPPPRPTGQSPCLFHPYYSKQE